VPACVVVDAVVGRLGLRFVPGAENEAVGLLGLAQEVLHQLESLFSHLTSAAALVLRGLVGTDKAGGAPCRDDCLRSGGHDCLCSLKTVA